MNKAAQLKNDSPYDAVVVGSGATGAWAAKQLTEKAVKVLLLEAGDIAAENHYTTDDHRTSNAVSGKPRQPIQALSYAYSAKTRHHFVDDIDNPYSTPAGMPFVWIRGRQLGGRTHTWAGQCYRFSDYDFKAATRDGYGEDWPISYEDLAPYYDQIETFLQVSGTRAHIPHLPDGPFMQPPPMSVCERRLKEAIEAKWKDRVAVVGRRSVSSVDGFGRRSYYNSADLTLALAAKTGRLTILADSIATHITVDPKSGRAAGVAFIDRKTGKTGEVSARVVVLCASTIESTRLLLNSKSPAHPDGMANSSGLLGRNLMDHITFRVKALSRFPVRTPAVEDVQDTNGLYIPRFRNLFQRAPGFLRGYGIQCDVQRLSAELQRLLGYDRNEGRHVLWMTLFGEMLPRKHNCVTLNAQLTDSWGVPAPHIACSHSDNELTMAADAIETMKEIAEAAGFEVVGKIPAIAPPGACVHEVGTAPMGRDRNTSVLNPFNQSWDVKNLFVTDGSCFVSQGSQNPTLTMMALTARACNFIVQELRRRNL